MPTITNGVTLEVRSYATALDEGYRAALHDPLWLLARQWQFDEFQGQDTGSPARVAITKDEIPITRYRSTGAPAGYAADYAPLEALVEREPLPAAQQRSLLALAEAGQQFLRLLAAHGAGQQREAYRAHYALAPLGDGEIAAWDGDSLRARQLLTGRVPDAVRLRADLVAALGENGTGSTLPAAPAIPAAERPKVLAAARAWLAWFASQGFSVPNENPAWVPERMEYAFAIAGRSDQEEVILGAPEYHGERMDWDSFDALAASSLGAPVSVESETVHMLPAPVSYRGMPNSRLWAFEDGRVNLGAVDGGAPDLATLVLVEFALVYGNDWFLAPLEVSVGALSRIRSLKVTDSFNVEQTIQHYSQADGAAGEWAMYAISQPGAPENVTLRQSLFLAPTIGSMLEGAPVEEVLFLRDEMANMAWAVERSVAGRAGLSLDRYEQYQATREAEPEEEADAGILADLAYRLGTSVPDYWIPLVPQEEVVGGRITMRLRRGAMPRFGPDGISGYIQPQGTILRPGQPLSLYEEEVPREGIRVRRAAQFARWIGGTSFLWLGNHKQPGRGEGSSGLRFDTVEPI